VRHDHHRPLAGDRPENLLDERAKLLVTRKHPPLELRRHDRIRRLPPAEDAAHERLAPLGVRHELGRQVGPLTGLLDHLVVGVPEPEPLGDGPTDRAAILRPSTLRARAVPPSTLRRWAGQQRTIKPVETWIQTELDSGERVISERLPHVRSATIGYWIGAGSRDETEARAGVSHFIEHLLFKGSSRFNALEIAEIFDEMGGELNAATSREHTVVYGRVPEHHVETALDVMGDMVFSPLFDDLVSEREVVLEEIAMYEDTPQDLVHDLIGEAVFGNHALGRPVIGTADVISTVTRRALRSHHGAFYTPANIVVAAAGSIDHDELVGLVQRSIERRSQSAAAKARIRKPLLKIPKPGLRFQRKETEQYHVCLGATGVSRSDRRRFAASILDAILGGSASSRLFQEIREKRGMAYSVYSFLSQYADTGQIGIYVGTREDNLAEALQITAEEVADIAAGNLRDGELARAQENLKGRLLLSMESTSARMTRLGKSLVTDAEILSLDRLVAEIDSVDADAVCTLAAELLDPARLSAAGIGPSEEHFLEALEHATPGLPCAA
jgi:predicted Zn-dependent peptidase